MNKLAFLCFLLVSAPMLASAQTRFAEGRLGFDESDLHVRFDTSAPVDAPRVSSEPGAVRLRFADATGDARIDLMGDGGAIRFVRVRPGAGNATVVVIRLTDRRQLDPDAVRVTLDGTVVDVAIARAVLPRARLEEPEVAPVAAAEPAAPPVEAVDSPEAEAPVEAPAAPRGAMFAPPEPLVIGHSAADDTAADHTAPPSLGLRTEGMANGRTSLLVLLALVAAAGLGLVHWLRTRRSRTETRLPITLVATHRISQRQQLVVVRALGQDHLLSIDGNRTERLCSQPAPQPQPATATEPEASATGADFGAHLAEMLGQAQREQPVARSSGYGPTLASAPAFSASQLLHPGASAPASMASMGMAPTGMASMGASHAGASEAVAGLLRLRARAFR